MKHEAEKRQPTNCDPTGSPVQVVDMVKQGLTINVLGLGSTLLGIQALVGGARG